MTSLIPVTTTRLGDHPPLLDLLPDSAPTAWVRGGEGLVGWGVHATTTGAAGSTGAAGTGEGSGRPHA